MDTYPKSCLELCFACAKYFQEKTNLKDCLRSLGDICQVLGKVQFGGAGPAEITTVRNKLHQKTLPWSFSLWHYTCLWWVLCLKNTAWPKPELEVLMMSSKLAFEDSEAKMESPPCVPPVAVGKLNEGMKKDKEMRSTILLLCRGLERWRKEGCKKRAPESQ